MPALPHRQQPETMIEQAMKDRAPAMYRELKASGALPSAIRHRAEMARENYKQALSEVNWNAAQASRNLSYLECVSEMEQPGSRGRDRDRDRAGNPVRGGKGARWLDCQPLWRFCWR